MSVRNPKIVPLVVWISFVFLQTLASQNTVGLLSFDKDQYYEGYNLFFPHNQSDVFLINNCGEIVHRWDGEDTRPGNAVYLLPNGNLVKCRRTSANARLDPIWAGGAGAFVEIRDWDNNLLWSFEQNDSLARLHHDVEPLPNGNILILSWESKSYEESIQAGRDTSKLPEDVLWPDYIFEINPATDEVVWEWHAWDHLVQDINIDVDNFGLVEESPSKIDINYTSNDGLPDWLHINAIAYNPVLDQIVMSVPHFDEFWIIDHSTTTKEAQGSTGGNAGRGGDLLFRWGNPITYRSPDNVSQRLFFQHNVEWINPDALPGDADFGVLSFFNNRVGPNVSHVNFLSMPYDPDLQQYPPLDSTTNAKPFERTIVHPDGNPLASSNSVSGAQLLDNGNVLICSGRWGYTYEITPENEVVWEYRTPLSGGMAAEQGDEPSINANLTFRMERYGIDYPAFVDRDLSPKGFIELSPNTDFCTLVSSLEELSESSNIRLGPNPVNSSLYIRSEDFELKAIQLYNALGAQMYSASPNSHDAILDLSNFNTGIYYLIVNKTYSHKLIVQH